MTFRWPPTLRVGGSVVFTTNLPRRYSQQARPTVGDPNAGGRFLQVGASSSRLGVVTVEFRCHVIERRGFPALRTVVPRGASHDWLEFCYAQNGLGRGARSKHPRSGLCPCADSHFSPSLWTGALVLSA